MNASSDPATAIFADWLRDALKTRGWSQRDLAAASGVNHASISRILSGEHEPMLGTATRIARALGLGWLPLR